MAGFWPNQVRTKNINAAETKLGHSIGICVASVESIGKLSRSQEWLESPREKILLGKAVKDSKEPVSPGNFSPSNLTKCGHTFRFGTNQTCVSAVSI